MASCGEVMTEAPVCCLPSETVNRAAHLMKSEDIGPVLVVENQQTNKLVGIVTDRDLAVKVIAEGRDPKSTRIEEVMTRHPMTCRAEDDLEKALRAMEEHQVRRIPIVDDQDGIVGIIAQADVATRAGEPIKTAEVVREISEPPAR
jgi:CBS domain-containing protein